MELVMRHTANWFATLYLPVTSPFNIVRPDLWVGDGSSHPRAGKIDLAIGTKVNDTMTILCQGFEEWTVVHGDPGFKILRIGAIGNQYKDWEFVERFLKFLLGEVFGEEITFRHEGALELDLIKVSDGNWSVNVPALVKELDLAELVQMLKGNAFRNPPELISTKVLEPKAHERKAQAGITIERLAPTATTAPQLVRWLADLLNKAFDQPVRFNVLTVRALDA